MKQHIIFKRGLMIGGGALVLLATACQKKFDPNSYKPAETFGGYTTSNQVSASSLVAHFSFENNLEDSVSGTSGTATGTSYAQGIKGNGLQVGAGNYATFTPTAAIAGLKSMTLSVWVNTQPDPNAAQEIICFANSTQFWSNLDMFWDNPQTSTSGPFHFHVYGSAGAQEGWLTSWTLSSPFGEWKHLVLTYDSPSNTFSFYSNGAIVGFTKVAGFGDLDFADFPAIVFGNFQFQTTPSLTSATGAQGWANSLFGVMDEVRIFSTALSASDVAALYQLEKRGL